MFFTTTYITTWLVLGLIMPLISSFWSAQSPPKLTSRRGAVGTIFDVDKDEWQSGLSVGVSIPYRSYWFDNLYFVIYLNNGHPEDLTIDD